MVRIKKAVHALKFRRSLLKKVKGYRFGRSSKERMANDAVFHAGSSAFAHRRDKKGDFRRLWNVKIGAAVRPHGYSYSRFIDALKKKGIALDRKSLATLAEFHPTTFESLVKKLG